MRRLIGFVMAFALHTNAMGQSAWKKENFATVTVANFRSNAVFNKVIDAGRVDYSLVNACLYYVVNEQRVKGGLPVVPHHIALETAAFFHSKKMAEQSFFDHSNPKDATRQTADLRARLAGIANPFIAECIYVQELKPGLTYLALCEGFTKGWMASTGHRDIIMSKNNKAFGAGIYYQANDYFGFRGTLAFQWFDEVAFDPKRVVDYLP